MRWHIIRLIWLRELRDQLRDRRTLFMVLVLPLLLYPVLGFAVLKFALGFSEQPSVIGIVAGPSEAHDFPPRLPPGAGLSPVPELAILAATPISAWPSSAILAAAGHRYLDYPLFIRAGQCELFETNSPIEQVTLLLAQARIRLRWLDVADAELLKDKEVDLILSAPADFFTRLATAENDKTEEPPPLELLLRPDDDRSKQARSRLHGLLENWKKELSRVRLAQEPAQLFR